MFLALTVLVGAVVGLLIGICAKKLIAEIDLKIVFSQSKLIAVGAAFGVIFALLICIRFSSLNLRVAYAILCGGLILQSMIDFLTHRLIRSVTHLMGATGVVFLLLDAEREDNYRAVVAAMICAVVGGVLFVAINKAVSNGLGSGDVRLVPVLGMYLGFLGYDEAIWAIFIACISASVVGVGLIVVGRGSLKHRLAFGPYLALGTLICVFVGEALPSVFG